MFKFNGDCCDAVAENIRADLARAVTKQDDITACGGDQMLGVFTNELYAWADSTNAELTEIDGTHWIACSMKRWVTERKPWGKKAKVSEHQLERMLARGRKKCVLETRQWPSRFENYKTVLHVRPADGYHQRRLDALLARCERGAVAGWMRGDCGTGAEPVRYPDHNSGLGTQTHTSTATGFAVANTEEGDFDKTPGEEDHACISAGSGYPEEGGKIIPFPKGQGGPGMPTVAETVAAQIAKQATKTIDTLKPDKVASMTHVWNNGFKSKMLAPYVGGKERGQFKQLIKTWPEGKAPAILEFVMSHWYEFSDAAEKHSGTCNMPASPNIDRLVKHQHLAVTLWMKSTLKTVKAKDAAVKPVQSVAQKQTVMPDSKPATFEEMQAIEAELLKDAS